MKNRIVFLYASWVVALIAMLGSLYFSEIKSSSHVNCAGTSVFSCIRSF